MNYSIEGEPMPVVICNLDAGETMITESGAMSWMSPNMKMETTSGGGIGKMLGRAFSGESLFLNRYTAQGGVGQIAFASSFPGSIRAFNVEPGFDIVAQKSAFLASTSGVELSVFFQKRFGSGLFGGEGFIMQKLTGSGTVFLEFDGYVKEYELGAGQQMIIDTGYLAAMSATCSVDIQTVPGVKNMLFGGEGLFNTVLTGPGKVYLQSMPVAQLAGAIRPFIPTGN
ncbi:MAG: TIGR00266 family protein [Lachnospiraceae bacterium]|nr:TIGR00266 family protein [Lachnospiraceae bacterium]